jgi:subtilisin family serine protease
MQTRSWARPALAIALSLAFAAAGAQTLKRADKADDLPRFSYAMPGEVEATIRDPQRFAAFAQQRRKDVESVLATYEIGDKAAKRQLLNELVQMDMLEGRYDDALKHSNEIRALQEKPADKLLSGMTTRAFLAAAKKTGARSGDAYNAEVSRSLGAELGAMPYLTVRNDIEQSKAGTQTFSESLIIGRVRNVLQPVASKTGSLSSDMAPAIISARYAIEYILPVRATLEQVYTVYLKAHQVDKPDIWKARDVALPEGRNYAVVPVVVWDSGVEINLFKGREIRKGDAPAMIAFDLRSMPSAEPLKPIPAELASKVDTLVARSKGLSDLQSNIDSPEAQEVRKLLSTLPPEQYKKTMEELRLTGIYEHGTHVSGIAMAGNPYARLANARIEFGHTLLPDPCPTPELEERTARAFQAYADFMKSVGARVVNMSWGGNLRSYEVELEQCGIGKDNVERKKIARGYFDMHLKALTQAMASAPDVLFVTSAGNSGDDATFNDAYPSGIVLPNLVSVGAVDKAGDEASFTSYGKTVVLHANGYQVDSVVPGGKRIAFSGTSMASPQVTNLAAKMLAVKPSLKPAEVIDIMRTTADRSEDGRRILINPKKALEAVGFVS